MTIEKTSWELSKGLDNGPISRSYWVVPGRFAAGAYPATPIKKPIKDQTKPITALINDGIDVFVNLTQDYPSGTDEHLNRYDEAAGSNIIIERFPIEDLSTPTSGEMNTILDAIDAHLDKNKNVYVHCWGGIGRTGTVVGCWMIRHRLAVSDEATQTIKELRQKDTARHRISPETEQQHDFVRNWETPQPNRLDKIVGCFLGGAIGDALGAGIEFDSINQIRDQFGPEGVTSFTPAYGHQAPITDDTQMTLFTAEGLRQSVSLGSDATESVWAAYQRWLHTQQVNAPDQTSKDDGLASNPLLYSHRAPGNTCLSALETGIPGSTQNLINDSKGCGGVMRAAPAGIYATSAQHAYTVGCKLAALTHTHPTGWTAAGVFAALVHGLLNTLTKQEALNQAISIAEADPKAAEVAAKLAVAVELSKLKQLRPEEIETLGAGWIAEEALAIAVCCFMSDRSPRSQMLLSVNHSGDSDSTGAILGNLIGIHQGQQALPTAWKNTVELRDLIIEEAKLLHSTQETI